MVGQSSNPIFTSFKLQRVLHGLYSAPGLLASPPFFLTSFRSYEAVRTYD